MDACATRFRSDSTAGRGPGAVVKPCGRGPVIAVALILVSVGAVRADDFSFAPPAGNFAPGRDYTPDAAPVGPTEPGAIEPTWAAPGLVGQSGMDAAAERNPTGPPAATFERVDPAPTAVGSAADWRFDWLPEGLLWRPPLANPREPRCYVTLGMLAGQRVIDTSIGADFGLLRIGPADRPEEGFQIDVFADMYTRFALRNALTAADYRAGVPLTFALDGWQMKLGYEYTGCHLGDEYMLLQWNYGDVVAKPLPTDVSRNEAVFGVARVFWDCTRLYGQFGYSFTPNDDLAGRPWTRYDWGIEYSPPALGRLLGGPFAAFDMDLRGETGFIPAVTLEAGWQWKSHEKRRAAMRLAFVYYSGQSPFGQFYGQREDWYGFTAIYEW